MPSTWRVKVVKGRYYLYHGDKYVGPVEDVVSVYEGWRRGRDSNPRGREAHRLSRTVSNSSVTPEYRFINLTNTQNVRESVLEILRIVKEKDSLRIELNDLKDVLMLKELLGLGLGLGVNNQHYNMSVIKIQYDDRFKEYLLKDRGLMERTVKDYINYLKRLEGKSIDYNLYLEISNNRWMVKCVRLYIDYLEKIGMLSEEEGERLRRIFKVKNKNYEVKPYNIDVENLVKNIHKLRPGVYKTILLLLYYSGVRLSETVKMLKEFDTTRLWCNEVFCRYFLGWRRGRKRCDYIYFPRSLLQEIDRVREKERIGTYDTIRDNLYEEYGVRPKEYRKLFYRVCRDVGVPKEVCDFYQSRISNLSIGDIHYDDLLRRADEYYTKILFHLENLTREKLINSETVYSSGTESGRTKQNQYEGSIQGENK
ncbi:MAG: integrase [Desulfurococcaceae archaeon]